VELAREQGFDPLDAEMWHTISFRQICKRQGGASVLSYYSHNYHKALLALFPDIGLEDHKYSSLPRMLFIYFCVKVPQHNFFSRKLLEERR